MRWLANLAALSVLASVAHAAPSAELVDLSCYRRGPDGEPNWAALKADYQRGTLRSGCAANGGAPVARAAAVPPAQAAVPMPTKTPVVVQTPAPVPTTSFQVLLRKDFSDVGLFSRPTPNSKAEGASISWSHDRIANDRIWAIDGLVAVYYSYMTNDYDSPLVGVAIGPYVKADKQFHSNPKVNDTDVVTFGGSGEIGIHNALGLRGVDYFRARWALTDDNVANRRTDQITGEWMPTYLRSNAQIPGTLLRYNFRPSLKVQYDQVGNGKLSPFSGEQRALRIGPEATLLLGAIDVPTDPESWFALLANVSGKVTYHWWTETYSGRQSSWLTSSLTYNLDRSGNLGLTFSYRNGLNEETGKKTDLFKISLNAKLCQELPSNVPCAADD